ncbi:hypothetical protein GCM10009841_03880 [Microlunatus panaciterrae]|uniref:CubicO group peptidase (Beta-lactamase class C family) n=1 Tax=Microlunatus panaciterrae TaxID=400768 RepID=A0ABS2RKC8_9ACTN|nr:serine hydrolase domain-containing protein [Microlunatus panaciterrae]MBM7798952.1 CubicO group peptidase (beta-lactamase class C family) [Microlunatus panaciterrae]
MVDDTQLRVQERVDRILNRCPAVGLAVAVTGPGVANAFQAQGYADIASKQPVTEDTVFRIASISKTFTAVAVMQLWEQGLLDLDRPANAYLRSFQLVSGHRGWRPATLRHLLTHTAGVPEWVRPSRMVSSGWFGESFAVDQRLPTLADYYSGGLRLAVEPGTIWTYSDHGFATLGQVVEDVSGLPLHLYLRQFIFEPLGMADSDLLRSERVQAHLATGYRLRSKGPRHVTDRAWVTAAASSIYSTPRDMVRYLAALLGGGSAAGGAILKPETLAMMFEAHHQNDPRIPGIGLGFLRANVGGHPVVEHQGVLPGFNSQIALAPGDGVGVVALTNGGRNAATWLTTESLRLLGDLLGAELDGIRNDIPPQAETWSGLCGWYQPRAQPTDMQAWAMLGAGVEVWVRRGRLTIRALSPIPALFRGLPLHPDDAEDPDVFRLDLARYGLGTARVVFSRDAGGMATGVHLDGLLLSAVRRDGRRVGGSG